jgi:HrpA-like RNA helicase
MSPRSKVRPDRRPQGVDRFGYRPSAAPSSRDQNMPYKIGQTDRQKLLDNITYHRLDRQWRCARIEKGREGWHSFGNKELPIERYRHDIMRMIATNRISLLAGETGSGKSTQLAQYALEMGYDRIVYLQPRRVTTDAISERIEGELKEQFDAKLIEFPEHLVGMAHSERSTLSDDSVIQIMTSAVFKNVRLNCEIHGVTSEC